MELTTQEHQYTFTPTKTDPIAQYGMYLSSDSANVSAQARMTYSLTPSAVGTVAASHKHGPKFTPPPRDCSTHQKRMAPFGCSTPETTALPTDIFELLPEPLYPGMLCPYPVASNKDTSTQTPEYTKQ